MNIPSAEALALAVKLSGHTHCQRAHQNPNVGLICSGCLGDAQTIDRELQLPKRNAALLLAQSICDEEERFITPHLEPLITQLRDALAAIQKTK